MIDVENEIFNLIATELRLNFSPIFVVGEYVQSPSEFPCVSLVEKDNTAYARTQTTDSMENHVKVMYELNVYSNLEIGKKTECKKIAAFIDDILLNLGFTRTMLSPIENIADATIYRITGRYTAVISKNKTIYRR